VHARGSAGCALLRCLSEASVALLRLGREEWEGERERVREWGEKSGRERERE
jgi:hypothetical protein